MLAARSGSDRQIDVKVKPKLKTTAEAPGALASSRVVAVYDWELLRSPRLGGLGLYLRDQMLAGARIVVVQGDPLPGGKGSLAHDADPGQAVEVRFPGLGLPVSPGLVNLETISGFLLRATLVAKLVESELPAIGISGVDLGLVREQQGADEGERVLRVNVSYLASLLEHGVLPVLGPEHLGLDGRLTRARGGRLAVALASSLGVERLEIVTRAPRLRPAEHVSAVRLTSQDVAEYLRRDPPRDPEGERVPRAALLVAQEALAGDVPLVRVGSLESLMQGSATEICDGAGQRSAARLQASE
jgi:hypothetical protein